MKVIITTAIATIVAFYGYSQTYLPLTGGTLTGNLMGTGATFNGLVNVSRLDIYGLNAISGDDYLRLNQYGDFSNGVYTPYNFRADGTVTFGGPLTGTSATFSSSTSNVNNIAIRTGSSTNYGAISLGRTSSEFFIGIAAVPNNFGVGTNAGDIALTMDLQFQKLHLGGWGGHAGAIVIDNAAATVNRVLNGSSANFSGNVGIGSTQANSNLYVHGTIKSKEVKVEASIAVPDYVFEKSYDLKPLSEVEKYIAENKHLPEIPSAKEIEKDGINVGNMQLSLLKKIEELTLYMIDLKKEVEVLNRKNQLLESKVSTIENKK